MWEIVPNFVAFLENLNFITGNHPCLLPFNPEIIFVTDFNEKLFSAGGGRNVGLGTMLNRILIQAKAKPSKFLSSLKLMKEDTGFIPSSIYSWSIGHILEHKFFCLGRLGSQGKTVDLRNSEELFRIVFSTFCGQNKHLKKN